MPSFFGIIYICLPFSASIVLTSFSFVDHSHWRQILPTIAITNTITVAINHYHHHHRHHNSHAGPVKCMPWISDLQREILFNDDVIAINQDVTPQGRPVKDGDLTVWTRKLSDGSVAVALYNQEDAAQTIGFKAETLGWPAGTAFTARDLWQHKDLGSFSNGIFPAKEVQPHETVALRVKKA